MSGQTWPKIGGFERTFDGAGHTISNLNVNVQNLPAGFIGSLDRGGIVKNLLLVNANISSNAHAGGIVGHLTNSTVIACAVSECKVSGTLYAGGIAGEVKTEPSSVIACYATSCDIQGPENASGHIAGMGTPNFFSVCFYDGAGNGIPDFQSVPEAVEQVRQNDWPVAMGYMDPQLGTHDYQWAMNPDEEARATLPLVLVPNPAMQ